MTAARATRFAPDHTLRDALLAMTEAFRAAAIDTPEVDARHLLQAALDIDGARVIAEPGRRLGARAEMLDDFTRRRIAREPVSRIRGWRDFYGRRFAITRDVLDPRPETETVIEAALELLRARGGLDRPISFADIGVGSGAIAVTLLAELPRARAVATDTSATAIDVARRNAVALGVADRLSLAQTDLLAGCSGPFELVVSNPPYIPTHAIAGLSAEVREHDPLAALDGGADGLDVYRRLCREIKSLETGFQVVLEVGDGQSDAVLGLLEAAGGQNQHVFRDFGGLPRAVAAELQR